VNVPGPARWWTSRQPGWLRNTVIAVIVGLAAGFGVLAVVAPLTPDDDAVASLPSSSPSPTSSWSLTLPFVAPSSVSPSPSRSQVVRSPSLSASPAAAGIAARYAVKDTWSGGYSAEIVITATAPADGWTVVLTMPEGVDVSTAWEADFRQNGRIVTFTPKSWNRTLANGTQIAIGFQASATGNAASGQPVSCTINGLPCS